MSLPALAEILVAILVAIPGARPVAAQDARALQAPRLADSAEAGLPYLRHHSPQEYGAPNQNFQVVQDDRGVIFAANRSGILEYDGERWRLIPSPDDRTVWTLAPMPGGIVLVGGDGLIGRFDRRTGREPRIEDLGATLPEAVRPKGDVRRSVRIDSTVFLATQEQLYRWAPTQGLEPWGPTGQYGYAWSSGSRFYIQEVGRGLLVSDGRSLDPVPGGEIFAGKRVFAIHLQPDGAVMVGVGDEGLYRSEGGRFEQFRSFAGLLGPAERQFHGLGLQDGSIVIGTNRGLVLLDAVGRLIRRLDRTTGLRNELINRIFVDRQSGMWLATQNGITRLEVPAALTHFDDIELQGAESIVRHNGQLHVSVRVGVLRAVTEPSTGNVGFRPVDGMSTECYGLLSTPQALLAACEAGVYSISGDRGTRISSAEAAVTLTRSRRDTSLVFVGESAGVALLRLRGNRWIDAGKVAGTDGFVRHLEEDERGAVWYATRLAGISRLEFDRGYSMAPRSTAYGADSGMPEGRPRVFRTGGRLVFATPAGLRRFDSTGALVPDTTFGPALATGVLVVSRLAEGPDGAVWMVTGEGLGVARPAANAAFRWDPAAIEGLPKTEIYALYPELGGVLWAGGADDLYRHDERLVTADEDPFETLLRRVSTSVDDSTLAIELVGSARVEPVAYARNAVRFEYAGARYGLLGGHGFQTRLDGFESDWSSWSTASERTYDRLPEGAYTFRVRAKGRSGRVGHEASVEFRILPPWYRTWWAYLVWLALFGGFIAVVDRFQRRRIIDAEQNRARMRESELRAQLAEERSRTLNELTELRSRFFSDVSHEFRTPLTLVMGPLTDLMEHPILREDEEVRDDLELALRNVRRLNRLVNELLDSARLEARQVVLDRRVVNLCVFVRQLTEAFAGLAEQTHRELRVEAPEREVPVRVDLDQFEKVILNLLSNAFKFTPSGGRVVVSVEPAADADMAVISVFNSGSRIAQEEMDRLFDRFYQADSARSIGQTGSGIGLSLVRGITLLHGGSVDVRSEDDGVTFTVTLPMATSLAGETEPYRGPATDFRLLVEDLLDAGPAAEHGGEPQPDAVADGAVDADDERGRPVVLVVDDNAEIRALVKRRLEPLYRVVEAADGSLGLAAVHRHVPDLVISDVMMPVMDGYAFCTAMKADPETAFIPVLLLTARAAQSDRIAGWDTGADAYLAKPFDDRELMSIVVNLLAAAHRLRDRLLAEARAVASHRPPEGPEAPGPPAAPGPPHGPLAAHDPPVPSPPDGLRERVMAEINLGLPDEDFGVDELVARLGTSRASLYREFADVFGEAPAQVLRTARLEKAASLLSQGVGNVSEVCYASGFRSVAHFSKAFRDHYQVTPSQYARQSLARA